MTWKEAVAAREVDEKWTRFLGGPEFLSSPYP